MQTHKPKTICDKIIHANYSLFDDLEAADKAEHESAAWLQAGRHVSRACERWVERGGFIVLTVLGVCACRLGSDGELKADIETGGIYLDPKGAKHYVTSVHTSPLGAVLEGAEVKIDWLADTCRVLKVEQRWVLGLLHAFDNSLIAPLHTLRDSEAYLDGQMWGASLRKKYLVKIGADVD